jgi:hypothetical protein
VSRLTCCKRIFQVYVSEVRCRCVSYGCCKSRSECCICCNGYIYTYICFFRHKLQVCVIWMLRIFHTYVASVSSGCCIC